MTGRELSELEAQLEAMSVAEINDYIVHVDSEVRRHELLLDVALNELKSRAERPHTPDGK